MTPSEIAGKAAEEIFREVEREQLFNKRLIAEAIERVLLTHQMSGGSHQLFMQGESCNHTQSFTNPMEERLARIEGILRKDAPVEDSPYAALKRLLAKPDVPADWKFEAAKEILPYVKPRDSRG
jgi:hypothetical protein